MEKLESGTIVNVKIVLCNIVVFGFGSLFQVGFNDVIPSCFTVRV